MQRKRLGSALLQAARLPPVRVGSHAKHCTNGICTADWCVRNEQTRKNTCFAHSTDSKVLLYRGFEGCSVLTQPVQLVCKVATSCKSA